MQYWLIKSEPDVWSLAQQEKAGVKGAIWDGVRNYLARNNLKKMKNGDLCFFYHSVTEKTIVGIVKVVKEHYIDPTDKTKKFVAVDVKIFSKFRNSVSLDQIKRIKILENMALIKQSRLSVMPVTKKEWDTIINMSK